MSCFRTSLAPLWILALALAPLVAAQEPAQPTPMQQYFMLMDRLQRYSTPVLKVKEMEKVGETAQGYLGLVRPEYASDDVGIDYDVDDIGYDSDEIELERPIGWLVQEVNSTRRQLYELVARHTDFTVQEAQREAANYFIRRTDMEHYVQTPDGRWALKQALVD